MKRHTGHNHFRPREFQGTQIFTPCYVPKEARLYYVPKEARLMDPFAKPTPLFWWQTTPCNTKEHRSQILETVRILPFAKHIIMDPFAKPTPLFWWQTALRNTKKHRSQILKTVRILPFAKHITPRMLILAIVAHCHCTLTPCPQIVQLVWEGLPGQFWAIWYLRSQGEFGFIIYVVLLFGKGVSLEPLLGYKPKAIHWGV